MITIVYSIQIKESNHIKTKKCRFISEYIISNHRVNIFSSSDVSPVGITLSVITNFDSAGNVFRRKSR